MGKSMTATDARKNFFSVLETAQRPGMAITITHEGHPTVIVMSNDEFEGWQETLDILSNPQLVKDIQKGLQEKGTVSLETLEKQAHALRRHVSSPSQKKRGETVRRSARKGAAKSARRIAGSA